VASTNTGLVASLNGQAGPAAVIATLMALEKVNSVCNISVSNFAENGCSSRQLSLRFRAETIR